MKVITTAGQINWTNNLFFFTFISCTNLFFVYSSGYDKICTSGV